MPEYLKTILFVSSAGCLLCLAVLVGRKVYSGNAIEFRNTGTEFFPGFVSVGDIAKLKISRIDRNGQLRTFIVQQEAGEWRLPGYAGYPAEATERLAATAARLIGLRRQLAVGRRDNVHREFGVIDPLSQDDPLGDGIGQRITLFSDDNTIIFDLIVGKPGRYPKFREQPH